jgi:hypothetical protein
VKRASLANQPQWIRAPIATQRSYALSTSPILDHEGEVLYPDAPEEDDIEGYYAFFVFDPDGIRVEVCSWTA